MPAQEEKKLTWKQKLEKGVPLSPLEETQADADFNFHQRERERRAREEFEAKKEAGRYNSDDFADDTNQEEDKKGKK